MVAREYVGAGGMRIHLDEPLEPMMAAQVDRGELRLVKDGEPRFDADRGVEPQVVQNGADAPAATRVGLNVPGVPERPDRDSHAGAWATYAVRLGLLATKASTMSKGQLMEWASAVQVEGTAVVGDAGEGAEGPEHASVYGRPNDTKGERAPLPVPDPESPATPAAEVPERPAATAKVADWRAYVIALGMDADQAKNATKQDCQDYAQVIEDARTENVQTEGQE